MSEWRDISTVPVACHVLAAYFHDEWGEWVMEVTMSPPNARFSHWMPLPGPPESPLQALQRLGQEFEAVPFSTMDGS